MKKVFLFIAALAMSAMTWATEQTLTFDLSKNPGGWPTTNSKTLTNYTYTLEDVDYTFGLMDVKCNSGYTMFTATAVMGLPAIEGYKLTKVVAKNTSGCSTAVKVGISSSASSEDYISGGDAQTWSKQNSSYTYELDETSDNTVYYLYVTNKNAQVTELELTYTDGTSPTVTLDSIVIRGKATKMEYKVGEAFDPAGLEVWGYYTKTVKHDSTSQIKSGIAWSIDPETFEEVSDNASVTLSVSYKDLTTTDTTITGIKVTEKPAKITTI
ncbi:MAG: hypothetical protein MJZ59_06050, partial [Paludibacteraceae bacterium]|nr:hypothetical protein [Paludibacteraceae bacterium]